LREGKILGKKNRRPGDKKQRERDFREGALIERGQNCLRTREEEKQRLERERTS